MGRVIWCLAAALALAAAPPAAAQTAGSEAEGAAVDRTRLLLPGDIVRLRIWREPDLSGEFPVDERGVVVFPKIGPYVVTDQTIEALKEKLVGAYQVYLRNPSIDVVPLRRINILGAVRNPGLYPVDLTMTLSDALALAGGTMPHGDPEKVELLRDGERLTGRMGQLTRIGDLPIRSGDQIYIPERSWFTRNSGVLAAGISAGASFLIALLLR